MWGRGEYGRLGLGDRSGSSKLRATQVHFREPDTRIVQVRTPHLLGHCRGTGLPDELVTTALPRNRAQRWVAGSPP